MTHLGGKKCLPRGSKAPYHPHLARPHPRGLGKIGVMGFMPPGSINAALSTTANFFIKIYADHH
jgi:hypothetical protein